MIKKPLINNRIRARQVRVIDQTGKQLGIMSLSEALKEAYQHNLDLIQITEKVEPPVCRLGDYGKYLYSQKKKERKGKVKKRSETKRIRLGFNISSHDLETRVKTAQKFLEKGEKVKIEMVLRGREKWLSEFGKKKFTQFLEILKSKIPIKIEMELKREPGELSMIIFKGL